MLFKSLLSRCPGLFGGLLCLLPLVAPAAPRTPTDPAEVLERLPLRPGDPISRELTDLRADLAAARRQNPADPGPAVRLAERYYDLAMARGDPRYIGQADAVLAPYAGQRSAPLAVVRGQLRQYRHDFAGALSDFAQALDIDPGHASAHAWRGALFLVQADYPSALRECEALARLQRAVLAAGCHGLLLAYTGKADEAQRVLSQALPRAVEAGNRLWLLTHLGELAHWQGNPGLAESHFRAALALGIEDGYLQAAWADFLLDQSRPAEVLKELAGQEASDPLLLRLALAARRTGDAAAGRHAQALRDRFAAARARGDTTHLAEEARFEVALGGDAARAVEVAAANYRIQKEPRDARALLEAALAARRPEAAAPVLAWLADSGFQDARLIALAAQVKALSGAPRAGSAS